MTDLSKQPSYDELIRMLIEKTKGLKLVWTQTAQPDMFLCSVKGLQSYRIWRESNLVRLLVVDEEGKPLLQHSDHYSRSRPLSIVEKQSRLITGSSENEVTIKSLMGDLHDLAKRIGEGLDEKIDKSLRLLESL